MVQICFRSESWSLVHICIMHEQILAWIYTSHVYFGLVVRFNSDPDPWFGSAICRHQWIRTRLMWTQFQLEAGKLNAGSYDAWILQNYVSCCIVSDTSLFYVKSVSCFSMACPCCIHIVSEHHKLDILILWIAVRWKLVAVWFRIKV